MSLMTTSAADEGRRLALRRMRWVATGLLLLAAAIHLATLRPDQSGVWGYLNTASEAAMVGAIADWFAVTALFRHPLGLPIPHTALVKRRKDELGRNLQDFVADNFLTEEIARDRLADAHVAHRLGTWLGEADHRQRVLTEGARVATAGLHRLRDEEVHALLDELVLPRLAQEPISPLLGSFLEGVLQAGNHTGVVDLGLEEMRRWLGEHPDTFAEVVGEKAPWWSPPWVDSKVIAWTYGQAMTWLEEVRADPRHPARQALDGLLERLAEDLQHDEAVRADAEALWQRLLEHPQVPATAVGLWGSLRTALLGALADRGSHYWVRGDELLAHAGAHLREDALWQERLEARLAEVVAFTVRTYGDELAGVIGVTVQRWDADEATARIELFVGRDLQFIRINGTVVGALVGLALHAVHQLIR